jgi:hypothetical protein
MVRFGCTLMTEQAGPRALVRHAHGAEQAGFDFEVMSDHYFPWLAEQGTPRTRGRPPARSPSRRRTSS